MNNKRDEQRHHCDFCGRDKEDVDIDKIIAGPKVNICNLCARLTIDILDEPEDKFVDKPISDDDLRRIEARSSRQHIELWAEHLEQCLKNDKERHVESNLQWQKHARNNEFYGVIQTASILITMVAILIILFRELSIYN